MTQARWEDYLLLPEIDTDEVVDELEAHAAGLTGPAADEMRAAALDVHEAGDLEDQADQDVEWARQAEAEAQRDAEAAARDAAQGWEETAAKEAVMAGIQHEAALEGVDTAISELEQSQDLLAEAEQHVEAAEVYDADAPADDEG
jgi:hypothetical protein